ncbi:MAG: tetratricopeptide repeat protein [Anaerolineae bacterium]|nr:tetratricopeptide repeat protein [Thermoflexus sp.]MDW8065096.1 tetratricopeptide repeat protein [Anaerolineae bacterium]
MKRFFLLLGWILGLTILKAGCTGTLNVPETRLEIPSPASPTATPQAIRPTETATETAVGISSDEEWKQEQTPDRGLHEGLRISSDEEWKQEWEEAVRRGDWKKAQAAYESAGRPPLPGEWLNRAMAQGIYMAWRAQEAGDRRRAAQQIQEVRDLIRDTLIAQEIPEGFEEALYFYLVLADSNTLDAWMEREKAISEDPLAKKVVRQMAWRDNLNEEDIVGAPVALCPIANRVFLVVGFQIFDLQGSFQGNAPGLDQLREGERIPRIYDVFCAGQKIQWVNVGGGGRGISLEAEWDGRGFRLVDLTRINLAAQTYEEVRKHLEAGELEKALEAYEKGFTNQVDEDPELATLALRQGLVIARLRTEAGDVPGALRALRAAFSIASVSYRLDWGTFLPQDWERQPRSLREWAREVSGADPLVYRDALGEYAALLIQDRLPHEAEPILRGLIVLDPDYAPAYLYLGDALWDQRKFEEARRFYRQYQELVPNGPWPDRVKRRAP